MNIILPFLGGMPTCRGAGGLAGQYNFGARTGGTNILEGLIEIAMGLLLSTSIASLFAVFPRAIIGAMMFMVGLELTKFGRDVRPGKEIIPMIVTVVIALVTNIFLGFIAGLCTYYLLFTLKLNINKD